MKSTSRFFFPGGRIDDTVYGILFAMTRKEKLIASILNNPKSVRFDDACKVAEQLGFVHKGGQGSHRAFMKDGEPAGLSEQKWVDPALSGTPVD